MVSLGAAELSIVTMLGLMLPGMWGIPLGMPPAAEDLVVHRIAPEECLFFSTWSARSEPKASSDNWTEKMLADPEIQRFTAAVYEQVRRIADDAAVNERNRAASLSAALAPQLVRWLLNETGSISVATVEMRPSGPSVRGCAVFRLGETGKEIPRLLMQFQQLAPPDAVTEIQVAEQRAYRLQVAPQAPILEWGVFDGYLVAGMGDGELAKAVQRMRGTATASWLTKFAAARENERRSQLVFFHLAGVADLARRIGGPRVASLMTALGFDNVQALVGTTAFDEHGVVSRTELLFDGAPTGVFHSLAAPGLTRDEIKGIPSDALLAVAVRLDLGAAVDHLLQLLENVDADAALEARDALRGMEEGLQVRLREDVLQSLGDTLYGYASPSTGHLLGGWTAVAEVKDRAKLQRVHDRLVGFAKSFSDQTGEFAIRSLDVGEHEILYLVAEDMPFAPAWCLTDQELVIGVFPQTVISHLGNHGRLTPLVDSAEVARLWDAGEAPLSLMYTDTATVFGLVYPAIQMAASVGIMEMRRQGVDISPTLLPAPGGIIPYLRPTIAVSRRTRQGIEFVQHQTVPGGNVLASSPVLTALLLPAVQSARLAARRTQSMNNLKQIGLALHNFHDTYGHFPAAYSIDADEKPKLSWRVYILPFVEEQALFDQFHLDEPWDSPHNRQLIERMPRVYRSPQSAAPPGTTTYLALLGENTVLAPPDPERQRRQGPPVGTRLADILDGTSNTVMVVEANDEHAVIWTKPEDYEFDSDDPAFGLRGVYPNIFLALFGDGSVRAISERIDVDVLRALFSRSGGEVVNVP